MTGAEEKPYEKKGFFFVFESTDDFRPRRGAYIRRQAEMRILVYGAGVQGCELAHRLLQNKKNVVTMLARGEWKERL